MVRALIMMVEDITDRLRMSRQLQRARKLEAMSTLAGGIAHEINQPLSALHLYAGGLQMLLEKQGELSSEVTQERLGLIIHEADKIRSIIAHMRSLVMQEGKVPLGGAGAAACSAGGSKASSRAAKASKPLRRARSAAVRLDSL